MVNERLKEFVWTNKRMNTYTVEEISLHKIIIKYVNELAVITNTYLYIHIRTLHTFKPRILYIYVNKYLHTKKISGLCCSFTVFRDFLTIF